MQLLAQQDSALVKMRKEVDLELSNNEADENIRERDELLGSAIQAIEGLIQLQEGKPVVRNKMNRHQNIINTDVLEDYYGSLESDIIEEKDKLTADLRRAGAVAKRLYEDATSGDAKEKPKQNRGLDFLATLGKISSLSLALTPMPTYLGVWGKQPAEQVKRVESVSFGYLLLATLSYAVWTSYAF